MQPTRNRVDPLRPLRKETQPIREEDSEGSPTDRNHTPFAHKELTAQQLAVLKDCFDRYCSTKTVKKPPRSKLNANGVREIMVSDPEVDVTISEKELGQLFQEAGMPLHKQTISHLCTQLCSNKKGKGVSFEDLLLVLREPCGAQESASDYEQVFRVYDRRNRGYFDYEDYKFVCEGISLDLTEGQIREAFEKIDVRRENKITLAGFQVMMKGLH